jgi:hypothetical protein
LLVAEINGSSWEPSLAVAACNVRALVHLIFASASQEEATRGWLGVEIKRLQWGEMKRLEYPYRYKKIVERWKEKWCSG